LLSPIRVRTHIFPSVQDAAARESLLKAVQEDAPEAVVAVGALAAVESVRNFSGTPVVYLMVVYPENHGLLDRRDAYGVSWSPSPETLAQTIRQIMTGAKTVGMLSSEPERDQLPLIRNFQDGGLELVISSIRTEADIPQRLRDLRNKVDVLWMGVDPLMANETAFDLLRTYASQNRIPFLVPLALLTGKDGVLGGISVSPEIAGTEAAQMVRHLLDGKPVSRAVFPSRIHLSLNAKTVRSIGLQISDRTEQNADWIE
jgi:ABC-type uncharacterized transport system substrate-binding protein